jgi:hypothetical protein
VKRRGGKGKLKNGAPKLDLSNDHEHESATVGNILVENLEYQGGARMAR